MKLEKHAFFHDFVTVYRSYLKFHVFFIMAFKVNAYAQNFQSENCACAKGLVFRMSAYMLIGIVLQKHTTN